MPPHNPRRGPFRARGLARALPGGRGIAVKRFPHGSARFEQAGPFASTRLLCDLDKNCGHPSRVLQAARASQGERLQMRHSVYQLRALSGRRRRPFEFLVVPLQEGDEIGNQQERAGFQVALPRARDRQQGIIKTIQVELIECPVGICRCPVGIQRNGLLGFGNRQLVLAGAGQGQTRKQCVRGLIAGVALRPRFQCPLFPFEIASDVAVVKGFDG